MMKGFWLLSSQLALAYFTFWLLFLFSHPFLFFAVISQNEKAIYGNRGESGSTFGEII